MAEQACLEDKKPLQQGVESSQLDYYDIMVIGKTGMGKSTTVDKMIIANPRDMREERSATVEPAEPIYDETSHKLECKDLTMWLVANCTNPTQDCQDDGYGSMINRLKNLVFCRSLENPHNEINILREASANANTNESTLECELLSNEHSKVRVLDVPGFFGREAAGDEQGIVQRLNAITESALGNVRKVLRIKNAHNMKIRRVVYFLPEHGIPKRTSQSLIVELQIMEQYFGRAIFDSMVVIATMPSMIYKHVRADADLFTKEDLKQTKRYFQEALNVVFKGNDVPEPPIEFISLFDTCEDVLHKIQSAQVLKDVIALELKISVCARCGVIIVEEGGKPAYCEFPYSNGVIPYEESTCHPMMIPKHPKLKMFLEGIHVILALFGQEDVLENMDEVCIECKQPPSSRGCMKISTEYCGTKISHSSSTEETYQIINMEGPAEEVVAVGQGAEGASIHVGVVPDFPMGGIQDDSVSTISQDENQPQDPNFDVRG